MTKRLGVVFPGYGQQFIGMGKDLYDESRLVQEFFEQAAGSVDINFVKLCFASSAEDISTIRNAYLAIYLFECSLYEILLQKGLKPDFLAGYGIGEYAACYASNSLSFIDGMYFINKYAQFYDNFIQQHAYSVLRVTRDFSLESLQQLIDVTATAEFPAYISAHNSPEGFYIAGSSTTIEKIEQYCKEHTIRKVKDVGPGYELHSELVNDIVEQLSLYYHKIQFKPLLVPVITNVDGVYVTSSDALQSAMMRKISNRVQWLEVMQGFVGCDVIISVGPGDQLIEWFKELYPDKEYFMISTLKDIDSIAHLFSQEVASEEIPSQDIVAESSDENQEDLEPGQNLHEADLINELPSDFDIEEDDEEL